MFTEVEIPRLASVFYKVQVFCSEGQYIRIELCYLFINLSGCYITKAAFTSRENSGKINIPEFPLHVNAVLAVILSFLPNVYMA